MLSLVRSARVSLVVAIVVAAVACGSRADLSRDEPCACVLADAAAPPPQSGEDASSPNDAGQGRDADASAVLLPAPRPIAPLSTATSTSQAPLFEWQLADGEDGAQIDICRDRACTTRVTTFSVKGSRALSPVLLGQGVYWWRVRGARGDTFGTANSVVWEVFVGARNAPKPSSWGSTLDLNADGFADVVVGAPSTSGTTENVFLYMGSASGVSTTPTSFSYVGHPNGNYRDPVASAGDVDGDGFPELIVGVPDYTAKTGSVRIYKGSADGLVTASPIVIPTPPGVDPTFGWVVAGAGDINGDGYADVLVGATQGTGAALMVFYGSASGLGGPGTTLTSFPLPGGRTAYLPRSLAGAGDVDGDGYADVLAAGYEGTYVLLFRGSAAGLSTTPILIQTPHYPDRPDQNPGFGGSVGCAGDVNADGYADIVIGAPGDGNGYDNIGSAWLYFGGPSGLSAPMRLVSGSADTGSAFGAYVGGAGDVNGDGYADILAATDRGDYLYLGSASGPALQAIPLVVPGAGQSFQFGQGSLGAAGDVDGDGFADVIAGAPLDGSYVGGAFLFRGSALGPGAANALVHPSTPGGFFGASVAQRDAPRRFWIRSRT